MISGTGFFQRAMRIGAAVGVLAATGDFNELGRRISEQITGQRRPLPATLTPLTRPNIEPRARGDRLIMASPPLERNGAPLSQFELARGLVERGWDVVTVATADGPLAAAYVEANLDLRIWPALRAEAAVPVWYEREIVALGQALLELQPGVVFANTLDLFPAIDAARRVGLPSVWNIREGEQWQKRLSDRHPTIAARALAAFSYPEAVIFVADASRLAWAAFSPAAKSHVIYNAMVQSPDAMSFTRDKADDGEFRILSVGTLCSRKGQLDLIHAQSKLPSDLQSRTKIICLGREEENYCEAMRAAIKPGLENTVSFPGEVKDVHPYFLEADLLVHCARAEAFPRVFLEAAAAGTPMIATRAGGAEERLREGETALFYDAGDAGTLATCIAELARSPSLRQMMAQSARRDLIEAWGSADMLEAYERLIRNALACGNQRA